ncbi:MAG: sensor histidine kinase [Acidimicrobiia bacterium]
MAKSEGAPVAGWIVVAAAWMIAAAALVLVVENRPVWTSDQWYFVVDLADAVVYGLVAWFLLLRVRHAVAWIVALTAIGGGVAALGSQWTPHPDWPLYRLVVSTQNWAWVPGTLALIVIVPWLVRDDPLDRIARIGVTAGIALTTFTVFGRLTDPAPGPDGKPFAPLAIESDWWGRFLESSFRWECVALLVIGLAAAADAVRRWAARPPDRRRGLGWLAIGNALLAISFTPFVLPDSVAADLPIAATPIVHLASQAFFPGAILVAVLGQRLWGADLAVSRTLVWSLLTATVITGYVGVVALFGWLLPSTAEGTQRVIATALFAAAFGPIRSWIQRRVDHLVHGDAGQPMRLIGRVGRRIGRSAQDEVLGEVLTSVVASLRLGGAAIVTDTADGRRCLAQIGELADGTSGGHAGDSGDLGDVDVPLVVQQETVGRLLASPRPGERLDGRTVHSLSELAPIVAATVQLATATDALRVSRARLASARDEERRMLRRELHDGLGPALAGIGLGLQAGRNLLARDPAAAGALLDRLAHEIDQRVEEVRGLARGLLPPVLEELGLPAALDELAERYRSVGLDVLLKVDTYPPLGPDVASAVYGIVSEAVRNVMRHAGASRCEIRIETRSAGELLVVVADDGRGIDPQAPAGIGTTSMRERAEGTGGRLQIAADPAGGTRVEAVLPMSADATR